MNVLVTGGAGFIGSHTVLELLESGNEVIVADNLDNSKYESLRRVEEMTGKKVIFYEIDLVDKEATEEIFKNHTIDSVIHFAGYKAVGESVAKPMMYYDNNLTSTLNLCNLMKQYGVTDLVFSSSATVYGDPASVPITEEFPLFATNPYGRTKLFLEYILKDLCIAEETWNIALLRYFNPVGAHPSGMIGEDPNGIPNNLLPFVTQVAIGKREKLAVYGGDYATHDGTGVRDYIHVVDLAKGHLKALNKLGKNPGLVICNLGTGIGYSVLDMVKAFEKASGKVVKYDIVDRRPGDAAACYADPKKAKDKLGWEAEYGINEMCEHAWNWQSQNPDGFK
ncbi:UDP-galactose 4-epimerase [Ochromonadaceae sp. CCMP2298]|nr:UDP-galactose 4-epimerase [Ochromonadaceae sp. CCMP2298]